MHATQVSGICERTHGVVPTEIPEFHRLVDYVICDFKVKITRLF